MIDSQGKVWWNSITGPATYKEAIVDSLMNRKNVTLAIQHDIPWRQQLRSSVEDEAKSNDYAFSFIDYIDENIEGESFLKYVIRKYSAPEIFRKYRDGMMKPHKFIIENHILDNKVLWVKGVPDNKVKDLVKEVTAYANESHHSNYAGTFVIEVRCPNMKLTSSGNIDVLKWVDYISNYDTLLFAYMIASQKEMKNKYLKTYLSHLSAEICGYDSEVCYEFLNEYDIAKDNPLETVRALYERYQESGRGVYEPELSDQHPFYYLNKNDIDQIKRRVWKAQVQVLFPYIEQQRIQIIERWNENLNACLPLGSSSNGVISEPIDVEIGTMFYLALCTLRDDDKRFEVDIDTSKTIRLLHRIRNKLAHLELCDTEEIMGLLS